MAETIFLKTIIPTIKKVKCSPGLIKLTIKSDNTMENSDPDNFKTKEVPRVMFFIVEFLTRSLIMICSNPKVDNKLRIAVKANA